MGLEILATENLKFLEAKQPQIKIESWSNSARTIRIRGISIHGTFSLDHTTNADRSVATDTFNIPAFPISLSAEPSAAGVRRGELYVKLTLLVAGFEVGILWAGYVSDSQAATWPPGRFESSTEGPGLIRIFQGTDQAANTEFVETVPANARWRIISLGATLVTDANAANRVVFLLVDNGTDPGVIYSVPCLAAHTASATASYYWHPAAPRETAFAQGIIQNPIPPDLTLFQGYRVRSYTAARQVGDNWGSPWLMLEEWIEE